MIHGQEKLMICYGDHLDRLNSYRYLGTDHIMHFDGMDFPLEKWLLLELFLLLLLTPGYIQQRRLLLSDSTR